MKDKLVREYGATALWLISTGAVCAILNRGFGHRHEFGWLFELR